MRPRCSILTGGFDFSGCGDCTSCPPIERAEMSNSEPSAIVFQGIACIRRIIHKVRFEWRDRLAHGSPQFTRRPIVCLSAPSAQILFLISVQLRLCRRKIRDPANRPSPKRLKVGDKFVSQWGCCIMHPESIGTCTVTVRRMSPSRSRPRSVAAGTSGSLLPPAPAAGKPAPQGT